MKAILESVRERNTLSAALANVQQSFSYLNYNIDRNIWPKDYILQKATTILNELKAVEWIAEKYSQLWMNKFAELKLKIEKLISELENSQQ